MEKYELANGNTIEFFGKDEKLDYTARGEMWIFVCF